jgi:hypothetical protein
MEEQKAEINRQKFELAINLFDVIKLLIPN